jgi:hypothetical protein
MPSSVSVQSPSPKCSRTLFCILCEGDEGVARGRSATQGGLARTNEIKVAAKSAENGQICPENLKSKKGNLWVYMLAMQPLPHTWRPQIHPCNQLARFYGTYAFFVGRTAPLNRYVRAYQIASNKKSHLSSIFPLVFEDISLSDSDY